ncbi:MAG: cobalamin B12-binding domain-containing protein [Armatimonadetes bacterium]|nr:cobalamin B12-binding domain-containing protein [Armatimonadota bacterium]
MVHPRGSRARVLLTSVFGPYAQDDQYGSRSINPMELYHNQVTRVQGPFSLRMFHRSWGLMMIQENIGAPSTLLDFPTQERFVLELERGDYDIVGISSIVANVGKVRRMCELIRRHSPRSTIVVGGHVAALGHLDRLVDADHVCRGEGIRWFRSFLGEDGEAPIRHPDIVSGFGSRVLGFDLKPRQEQMAATLIPSVGCPMGCNFCATSALFGGKGNSVDFFRTGQELYDLMTGFEERMKTRSFFIMDENFLLRRDRALELLDLMKRGGKDWSLYVFSSAHALRRYSMQELVGLGVSWVWTGLEGENSEYAKLRGIDTLELVPALQEQGIRVLGSSIIGLESHTPENIDRVIDRAVRHRPDFHQFMLYTPLPGTPLHADHADSGTLLPEVDLADIHGQYRLSFRHPHITPEQSEEFLLRAFRADFEVNGPSLARVVRTMLQGWRAHRQDPDPRVRRRSERECAVLRRFASGTLWAMERYVRDSNRRACEGIGRLRKQLGQEFGLLNRVLASLSGPLILASLKREARRLSEGLRLEPPTFLERRNWAR